MRPGNDKNGDRTPVSEKFIQVSDVLGSFHGVLCSSAVAL
jgi:hypothetical protein